MYSYVKQTDKTTTYVSEFIADTTGDIDNIPVENIAPGSTCIVIDSSEVYMLNTKKEWIKL